MVFSVKTQVSMKLEDGRNIHWRSRGFSEDSGKLEYGEVGEKWEIEPWRRSRQQWLEHEKTDEDVIEGVNNQDVRLACWVLLASKLSKN